MKNEKTFNTEKSLARLAELVGIDSTKYGWKSRLSEWMGVKTSILANWIRRGLPKGQIESIVKKGYPSDQWLIPKSPPEATISGESGGEAESPRLVATGAGKRLSHNEIIEWFRDKEWAVEMNLLLVELERAAPHKKDVVAAFIRGILEMAKPQKKGSRS